MPASPRAFPVGGFVLHAPALGLLVAAGVRPELAVGIVGFVVVLAATLANYIPPVGLGIIVHALGFNAPSRDEAELRIELRTLRSRVYDLTRERDEARAQLHGKSPP